MKHRYTTYQADLDSASDRGAVVMLLNAYACDPMGMGQPLSETTLDAAVDGLRAHPASLVFLTHCGDVPIGLAICFRGFSTFAGRPLVNIHDLVVHADFRRQGVAQQLLHSVQARATELGCCKLTLEVRHDNHSARSLYQQWGFAPDQPTYEFWKKPLG